MNKLLIMIAIFIINNTVIYLLFHNIHKNEEYRRKSLLFQENHDNLANHDNRNYLSNKFLDLKRSDPFTLLFIDIDNFKAVNDGHGHSFGDIVLKQIAVRISALTDENDILVRHSGDEVYMMYQPQVDNKHNLYGVEALVRWKIKN